MTSNSNHEIESFGSTLFHHILNPLTVISLELDAEQKKVPILQDQVDTMIHHLSHLEYFVSLLCQNIKPNTFIKSFSLNEEIENIIGILSYKAKKYHVQMVSLLLHEVSIYGNQLKFHEYIMSLFDIFFESAQGEGDTSSSIPTKRIEISLEKKKNTVFLGFETTVLPFSSPNFADIQRGLQQDFGMKILFTKEKLKQKIICKLEAKI